MSKERRNSFRCLLGGEDLPAKGVLHTRRGDVTVKLTDRSSAGFGIVVPTRNSSHVNENEEIAFTVGGASSLVRVVHQSELAEGMVVGLEILRELPAHLSKNYAKRNQSETRSSRFLRYGMLTACAVLIALNIPWNRAFSAFKGGEHPPQNVADGQQGSEQGSRSHGDQASEVQLAKRFLQLDQLNSQQAITRLKLSTKQQHEISSIVKETTYSMEVLFKNREAITDTEWTTLGLSLLQNSARRIEATLNEQQRAEWANLMQNAPSDRGTPGN